MNSVCVVEAARGQGIGRGLIGQAEQWAQSQGATDIRLTVWTFNATAQGLYEELGYAPRSLNMGKPLEP
ncbi:MAG: GNAT family N-acetyltransferase [Ideonella sp.]|nr:GNAT family N-acetyltransferase [Ideonella sp.]